MIIKLNNVCKVYEKANAPVVENFNLEIEDKEFIVFVGPSGCGKSTTLRMIAGLENITSGDLYFDDKRMNNILPKDRNVAMVFQSYALYPNMTVYQNMEFPLKMRRIPKEERKTRIMAAAEMLGLMDFLERKPKNLSGGQRQRVAVGREIVRDVDLFLMDEPLSNLDAKLRVQMRSEITKLHKELQKTFIYVTHDQVEAMTMATRIVVMKDGIIQQVGTPKEVYDTPANMFVAGFIGTPSMNFITGTVTKEGYFVTDGLKIKIHPEKYSYLEEKNYLEKTVVLGIRPEDIHYNPEEPDNESTALMKIDVAELLGYEYNLIFSVNGHDVAAKTKASSIITADKELPLFFDTEKCHFFDPDTEKRI